MIKASTSTTHHHSRAVQAGARLPCHAFLSASACHACQCACQLPALSARGRALRARDHARFFENMCLQVFRARYCATSTLNLPTQPWTQRVHCALTVVMPTIPELKELLRAVGLRVSGNKSELEARLARAIEARTAAPLMDLAAMGDVAANARLAQRQAEDAAIDGARLTSIATSCMTNMQILI